MTVTASICSVLHKPQITSTQAGDLTATLVGVSSLFRNSTSHLFAEPQVWHQNASPKAEQKSKSCSQKRKTNETYHGDRISVPRGGGQRRCHVNNVTSSLALAALAANAVRRVLVRPEPSAALALGYEDRERAPMHRWTSACR